MSALPRFSDIDLFGYCKGIVHFECLFPPQADETGTPAVRANGIFSRHTAFSCVHRQRLAAPPIRPSGRFPLSKSKRRADHQVWLRTLYAHMPVEGDNARELQITLSRTLVSLASDGMTNPADLRRKALEMMALNPR